MLPTLMEMQHAVLKAGKLIAQQNLSVVNRKADESLVTEIDTMANDQLKRWSKRFAVGFIGEEGNGDDVATHDYIVYVDPLDGTSSYVAGKAEVAVVMTLMRRTDNRWFPTKAIIHEPLTGRTWTAETGKGVRHTPKINGRGLQLRAITPSPEPAFVSVITWRGVPFNLDLVRNFLETETGMHHHGSGNTSINGGLIASGRMHACVFGGSSAVETAAMSLIVKEAGGVATDFLDEPLSGFELQPDSTGKLDFTLNHGAIIASDTALANTLAKIVQLHQFERPHK